jgi:uncharacterized protein
VPRACHRYSPQVARLGEEDGKLRHNFSATPGGSPGADVFHCPQQSEVSMSEAHKQLLQAANSAISKGDHEDFLKHCTEDTQWHFIGDRTLSGKDMVRQWLAEAYQEPPAFEVNHLISEGDWLTALGEITSKDDEGNEVRYAYCDVWRFEGDKLAELRAFVIRPTMPE